MSSNRRTAQATGHGEKRGRKTEAAIAALLTSGSIIEAAKACGIAECTLRIWMAKPEFRAQYDEARRQILDQVLGRLQATTGEAVEALLAIVRDGSTPPGPRVAAARGLLDLALKIRSEEEFETRLRALEEAQHEDRT